MLKNIIYHTVKLVIAIPIKPKSSIYVFNILIFLFYREGPTKIIQTDNGKSLFTRISAVYMNNFGFHISVGVPATLRTEDR